MGLCEVASHEHDQERLGAFFEQYFAFWKDQQVRLKKGRGFSGSSSLKLANHERPVGSRKCQGF